MCDQLYRSPAKLKKHTDDSDSFFGALGFTSPVEQLALRAAPAESLLTWLTMPTGPHLVEAVLTSESHMALAILVTPGELYNSYAPRVGLGLVYKAPYIKTASFSKAFYLKSASEAEADKRITNSHLMFVWINEASKVIPLPYVQPLFLDVPTTSDITDSNKPQSPRAFRAFRLHRVIYMEGSILTTQVAYPRPGGKTKSYLLNLQKQLLIPELREHSMVLAALADADDRHWNVTNDLIYPACLEEFRRKHESSQASKQTNKSVERSGIGGGSPTCMTTPPVVTSSQPAPTPTLGALEVRELVRDTLDQVYALCLETLQEMGFIQEVDRALAKSIMSEFLRLQLIVGDDLNTSLWAMHADLEATTAELMRDLDLVAQNSTALPSKNPAVRVALHRFLDLVRLKLALPLAQVDMA